MMSITLTQVTSVDTETDASLSQASISGKPSSALAVKHNAGSKPLVVWNTAAILSGILLLWLSVIYNCRSGRLPTPPTPGAPVRQLAGMGFDGRKNTGAPYEGPSNKEELITEICALVLEMEEKETRDAEQRLVRELNTMISAMDEEYAAVAGAATDTGTSDITVKWEPKGTIRTPVSISLPNMPPDAGDQYRSLLIQLHTQVQSLHEQQILPLGYSGTSEYNQNEETSVAYGPGRCRGGSRTSSSNLPSFRVSEAQSTPLCSELGEECKQQNFSSYQESRPYIMGVRSTLPTVPPEEGSPLQPWNISPKDVASQPNSGHTLYIVKRVRAALLNKQLDYKQSAKLLQHALMLVLRAPHVDPNQVLAFPALRRARRLGVYVQIVDALFLVTELFPQLTRWPEWWSTVVNKATLLSMLSRMPVNRGAHWDFCIDCIRALICFSDRTRPAEKALKAISAAYDSRYSREGIMMRKVQREEEEEEFRKHVFSGGVTQSGDDTTSQRGIDDASRMKSSEMLQQTSPDELSSTTLEKLGSHLNLAGKPSTYATETAHLSGEESTHSMSISGEESESAALLNVPKIPGVLRNPFDVWDIDRRTFESASGSGGIFNNMRKIERYLSKGKLSESECRDVLRSARKLVSFVGPLRTEGHVAERAFHIARRLGVLVEIVDVLFRVTSVFPNETRWDTWWEEMFDVVNIHGLMTLIDRFKVNRNTLFWAECWHLLREYKRRLRPPLERIQWVRSVNETRYRRH